MVKAEMVIHKSKKKSTDDVKKKQQITTVTGIIKIGKKPKYA